MSRAAATALVLLLLLTAVPAAAAEEAVPGDPETSADVVPGEVIVGWRDAARGPEVARRHGLAVVENLDASGRQRASSVLATRGRSVQAVIAELEADPAVEYAEPNYVFGLPEPDATEAVRRDGDTGTVAAVGVNDPKTGGQYSLDRMKVRDAWSLDKGGSNLVAVLDTGVQSGHPDLQGRVVRGYDFVNNDTGASDDNGHGTWVAGIIASNARDGYGIAGISWTDKILPVKIMNSSGTGSTSDLASGIVWAANKGADVINMSVGGFPYSQAVLDAVNHAWGRGAVLVGAAGNNHRREDFYPASYDRVVSVSATQPQDEFSFWSSYGPKVDVSAPGSSVLTTNCISSACPHRDWGSHTYISGTSFATPNVAGVVALIMARYPGYSPSQVVNRLKGTVDDLGYYGRDDRYGLGRVNAYRALGATTARPQLLAGDGLEGNNTLATAEPIGNSRTTQASIYPAGDVDWFAVRVPRAGRIDIRVTGVVDSRDYPWNRSGLPVDPIVELYNRYGNLITRVDREWEGGVELVRHSVGKGTRVLVRVVNYYANGNRNSYSVTPTFVDTVAPVATIRTPTPDATGVSQWIVPTATFSEAVSNVTSGTVRLRDLSTLDLVPASVAYDASRREVRLTPSRHLDGNRTYRLELTPNIIDAGGNSLALTRARFTTSSYVFSDIQGTKHAVEIQWLGVRKLVTGCGSGRFCPSRDVVRTAAAVFVSRSLALPPTTVDYFTDDDGRSQEDSINRVAAAGIIQPCAPGRFCPGAEVRRGEMAAIVTAAFDLPPASRDYFTDDEGRWYEDAINRVTAAGLMSGCGGTKFCRGGSVSRGEFAAILYHGLND